MAVQWFEKAAGQGHIGAKAEFATMYCTGDGIPVNYAKAEAYYKDVIAVGESFFGYDEVIFKLGNIYYKSDIFIEGYRELLLKIHGSYPETEIVCMIPFNQSHAEDIRAAVEEHKWCHVAETDDWQISYSDEGLHPDEAGSRAIGNALSKYILSFF